MCKTGWTGNYCEEVVACHPLCDTCRPGTSAHDCIDCVDHASWHQGECICDVFWSGETCDVYQGPCDDRCIGCTGPSEYDCLVCVTNSHEVYGACLCNDGYSGCDCTEYVGKCAPKCLTCTGPTVVNCVVCIPNACRDEHGICDCK